MAAISVLCSQPAVQNDRPGEAPPRVVVPALATGPGEPSGAHQDDVAATDLRGGALGGDGGLQVLLGDGEAVGQLPVLADDPADVQQHAAGDDRRGEVLDPGDQVAVGGDDVARRAPVPGHAVVEDVPEPVPLRRALQGHGDDVVGAADPVREALLPAAASVPVSSHGVDRVGPPSPALLRAVGVERLRQRDRYAAAHQPRGLPSLGLVDEVHGAEAVVRSPAAPVPVARRGRGDGLLGGGRDRLHQTGGATKTASGSLNERLATNSFIWLAVPHWSVTSGSEKSYRCGCQVSSSIVSSSVGVLDGVALRVQEVGEGVVARHVAAGTPDLLHPGAHQPAGAAHVLVQAAHLERHVVQRDVRAAGDGDVVVVVAACAGTTSPRPCAGCRGCRTARKPSRFS